MGRKFEIKTPKGTRDFGPAEMAIRERVINKISSIFKKHGGVSIETPVFELRDVLTGKYGEDSKLIYDLQDQGGEICSLRYDLTVPFARFLAMNKQIKQIKRVHIAKVYRRDQPIMTKGRYREFYQCDFDIAGVYESMLPESELFKVATEILDTLQVGEYVLKFNHRKLLDAVFEVCGVEEDKLRSISSAVDKLDKLPWPEVKEEMKQKGISAQVADSIWEYVQMNGDKALVAQLRENPVLMANEKAVVALNEIETFFQYLDVYNVTKVSFDLSLARGLDYYTGLIFEGQLKGADVGSICGGGRYDDLVGMFSPKGHKIPCVGFSVGIERLFSILQTKYMDRPGFRTSSTQVFVAAVGDGLLIERMKVCNMLWESNISAEFTLKKKPKYLNQVEFAEKQGIPILVIIGPDELAEDKFKLKIVADREDKGTLYPLSELVSVVKQNLDSSLDALRFLSIEE